MVPAPLMSERHSMNYTQLFRHSKITSGIWQSAMEVAGISRASGLNVSATDIVVFCCARAYRVELRHNDHHYDLLDRLFGNQPPAP